MLSMIVVAAVFASSYGIPTQDVCLKYQYLYDQCLPPTSWICDKPAGYQSLEMTDIRQKLISGDQQYINYIQTCAECIGTPADYHEIRTYRKQPVCREVKVPVLYVNKPIHLGQNVIRNEVCQVILNNAQQVYKTECYNGNKKRSDRYCNFDYGTFKQYFCRPTNFVYREMLVNCPSTGLQYYKEKVSTACSCVRMKCVV